MSGDGDRDGPDRDDVPASERGVPPDRVSGDAVDALVAAADGEGGVRFEGLSVESTDDGYRFSAPGTAKSGLTAAELRETARRNGAAVAEWHFWTRRAPSRTGARDFLAWLEDGTERYGVGGDEPNEADSDGRDEVGGDEWVPQARRSRLAAGVERDWGQLRIAVRLDGDGRRSYDLRHRRDADVPVASLTTHADPGAATELARYDADGDYRPLKTAPTLAGGWVFPDLDAAGLVRAVDDLYPTTIANWHRERQDALDATHWRETAERQTGIYDLVDELAGEQVAWLAEACCVDSQCLKRREWDETADEPLPVPRGDGEFPCREPCSLVIAAAREVALAEREADASVTLEVSPAERDQLARIVEAVAEGEVEEIRDGDFGDGANRLRARYLRAKHFHDGTFPMDGSDDADE